MTLMSFRTSGGSSRRCDEKCYNASGPECLCCCGGINHGAGRKKAVENTARVSVVLLEMAEKEWRGEIVSIKKRPIIDQLCLLT